MNFTSAPRWQVPSPLFSSLNGSPVEVEWAGSAFVESTTQQIDPNLQTHPL
jgi:hypothetical protein